MVRRRYTQHITILVSEEMLLRLIDTCDAEEISTSAFIRRVLAEHFNAYKDTQVPETGEWFKEKGLVGPEKITVPLFEREEVSPELTTAEERASQEEQNWLGMTDYELMMEQEERGSEGRPRRGRPRKEKKIMEEAKVEEDIEEEVL